MGTNARRSQRSINTWPGFVDALATLLMVIIFLLMIFVIAQFFLNDAISGRDEALSNLESQVSELADMLALERKTTTDLRSNVEQLSQELKASVATQDELRTSVRALSTRAESAEDKSRSLRVQLTDAREKSLAQLEQITELVNDIDALTALRDQLEEQVTGLIETVEGQKSELGISEETINRQLEELARLAQDVRSLSALKSELEQEITGLAGKVEETEGKLLSERELSESARAEVALLTQQMNALRDQLSQISSLLSESEAESAEQKAEIQSLGKRLNAALAGKVQELSRYRSEFFGRLREILGNTAGVQIVGDRFVLQSELLFDQGSADLGAAGQKQIYQLGQTLIELSAKIPEDINWILRVDGHTDSVPIRNNQFPSNWELSSARAISVVKHLIAQGLPPTRLAAAGFGEHQPIEIGKSVDAMQRNRRIELKLTQR